MCASTRLFQHNTNFGMQLTLKITWKCTYKALGANKITQATPACFLIAFVTTFGKIFKKYSWNIFEKSL
jgi:hypothetical protein